MHGPFSHCRIAWPCPRRHVGFLLLALLGLGLPACQGPLIPQGSGIAATCISQPAIVSIYTWQPRGFTGSRAQGTGFCISRDEVVTNLHVIEGATAAAVRFADGRDRAVVAVIAEDVEGDLVLLKLAPGGAEETPLVMSDRPLEVGLPVRIVGSPDGAAQTEIHGRVASRVVTFDVLDEAIMLSASVSAGMSGSPVLDQGCGVVGILSRGTNFSGQAYMVPVARLDRMERKTPVPLARWTQWKARQPSFTSQARFGDAALAFEGGDPDQAIGLLQQAIALGLPPAGHATAWYVIGDAHTSRGREAEAVAAYRRATALRPRHALAHGALALAHRRVGRFTEALAAYDRALELMPTLARFHVGRGWTLLRLQRIPDARDAFTLGTRLDPCSVAGWTGLATAELAAGAPAKARTHATRATRIDPNEAKAWWVLATAYQRLGARDEARRAWQTGLALDGAQPRANYELGRLALAAGDRETALAQAQKLRDLRDPEALRLATALIAETGMR